MKNSSFEFLKKPEYAILVAPEVRIFLFFILIKIKGIN